MLLFLPASVLPLAAGGKPRDIGASGHKHGAGSAPQKQGPWCLSAGPYSSSMEKHRERPDSPSAQEGCFSLANKNCFRCPELLCPLSGAGVRPLRRLPGPLRSNGAFVSRLCLFLPSFLHTWPFSALVGSRCPPSVDDGSSAAARVKMVVSGLHNGSG